MSNTLAAPSRRARPADVAAVTALLVTALEHDPVAEWLLPDPQERLQVLHPLLAVDVDHAIETGRVEVALDWSAVAVWRAHAPNTDRWMLRDHHLTTFAGRAASRLAELNAAVHNYRSAAPHHWLSWLAVHPNYGWRTAGDLLDRHHDLVDGTGLPTYAVTTTEAARDLLSAHGYRADLPLHLPSGPRLWPLSRAGCTSPRPGHATR
ncbi:hypothetical protein [Micromonospora sp. NPDC047740]|uniref:hypothetical protein n=1 Tax=Micromonospora sp. NPDC047740 TaxID=3364254 RepID=UPI003716FA16